MPNRRRRNRFIPTLADAALSARILPSTFGGAEIGPDPVNPMPEIPPLPAPPLPSSVPTT